MLCPTTPRAGSVGGFVGEFCWRTPRGGRRLVLITFCESVCKCTCVHAYHVVILNGRRDLLVHLQTLFNLAAETKLSASMVALLYVSKTKVSNVLFQNSKLYLSISWGLSILNPPSGWGFDKPEVQIPTFTPYMSRTGGSGA